MKLYLFKLNKNYYDQYDSFVVVAENEEDVINYLKKEYPESEHSWHNFVDWSEGYTIKEIKPEEYTQTEVILGSFNAG